MQFTLELECFYKSQLRDFYVDNEGVNWNIFLGRIVNVRRVSYDFDISQHQNCFGQLLDFVACSLVSLINIKKSGIHLTGNNI